MAKKTLINAIINLLNQSFQDDNRVTLSNDIEKQIIQTFEKLANATMKLTDVNEQIIDLCLNNIQKEKKMSIEYRKILLVRIKTLGDLHKKILVQFVK